MTKSCISKAMIKKGVITRETRVFISHWNKRGNGYIVFYKLLADADFRECILEYKDLPRQYKESQSKRLNSQDIRDIARGKRKRTY